jgi:hypothetical protein
MHHDCIPDRAANRNSALKTSHTSFGRCFLTIALLGTFGLASISEAQISIPDTNPVTQNFDGIATTNTASLPASWKMSSAGTGLTAGYATGTNVTVVTQATSSGSPSTGGRYNWGNGTTTTDRAIGFMTSGTYSSPNSVMAYYVNNTGSTITSLAIAYDVERYRINSTAANLTFYTSTDGTTWTPQTAGDSGAFATGSSSYTFTGGTVVNKSFNVNSLSISAGGSVYLRWTFDTTGSSSQGLGLDNVSVTASTSGLPSPAISSFTPSTGWIGTIVTLTGLDFTGASAVKFNGTDAANFTVDSDTQITCTAPTVVATGKISVTTANGTGLSLTNFTAVDPDSLTLSASPTSFAENASNPASTGTVTRLGSTASEIVVTLSSNGPTHATVPTTVTIPAGSASANFDITAIPDSTVTADNSVTITASSNSFMVGTTVTVTNVDLAPLSVVINKISNSGTADGSGDRVELLVVGNQTPGSTVDMRGIVLKDFSSNGTSDGGGAYEFANTTFWSAIPVGTLITIEAGNAVSNDTVAADYVLRLGANDTTYFTQTSTYGINIGSSDLVMIKAAGFGSAGTIGAIHLLAIGTPTTFYTSYGGYKLNATATTGQNKAAIATNATSTLADYNGTGATGNIDVASVTFGTPNNATNATYISQLRGGLSDGYSIWIDTYFSGNMDPNTIGFDKDPDFDGIPNGVEALIGGTPNSPGVFATTELVKSGNVFTFVYPQARNVPSGVTAAYEWSADLLSWHTTGQSDGVNTVTLADGLYDDDNVSPTVTYQVTATVTVGTPVKLFVRVIAHN